MRQLGTLPDAATARTLCGYLESLAIETRLDETPTGCVVWVCDEDKVAQAREQFQQFLSNPSDPRFAAGAQAQPPKAKPAEPPRRRTSPRGRIEPPPVTTTLLVLSILVTVLYEAAPSKQFVAGNLFIEKTVYWSPQTRPYIDDPWLLIELEGKPESLYWWPKSNLNDVRNQWQVWRLITPIFIHLHFFHLLFNMLCLWDMGRTLERFMGWWRFLLFVLFTAVLSNLAQYYLGSLGLVDGSVVSERSPAFGGISGVCYALFGFLWIRAVYDRRCGLVILPGTVVMMIGWFFLCMTGAVGAIGNMAHLVGLVLGMMLGYIGAWRNGFGQSSA